MLKIIEEYNGWHRALKMYFWFLSLSWAGLILFLILLPKNIKEYTIQQWYFVIAIIAFWLICYFFVKLGTIRRCEKDGIKITKGGLIYKVYSMSRNNNGDLIKKYTDIQNKQREKYNPDNMIKEFLKKA